MVIDNSVALSFLTGYESKVKENSFLLFTAKHFTLKISVVLKEKKLLPVHRQTYKIYSSFHVENVLQV